MEYRILVLMASTLGERPHVHFTVESNRHYSKCNGYNFVFHDLDIEQHLIPLGCTPHWSKITAILHHLPYYDYLFWIDDDAMFLDSSVRIESFIVSNPQADFILTRELNPSSAVNTGVMLVKNSDFSHLALQKVLQSDLTLPFRQRPLWEQSAFEAIVLEPELPSCLSQLHTGPLAHQLNERKVVRTDHVAILHEDTMNGQSSSFILHLACFPNEVRERIFRPLSLKFLSDGKIDNESINLP